MLKRSSFGKAAPQRPDRSAEFASYVPAAPVAVMASRLDVAAAKPAPTARQKTMARVVQSIRDSARGEECQLRFDRVCLGTTDTTVWCHWPGLDAGRGMGLKALDLAGCYGCLACHDVLDMRAQPPAHLNRQAIELGFLFGHLRSLVRLGQKGVLT